MRLDEGGPPRCGSAPLSCEDTNSVTSLLLSLILLTAAPSRVEAASDDARCAGVQQTEFPASDRPNAAQRAALRDCDSEDLYYGITRAADPVRARLCAYTQLGKSKDLVFGGEAILMMVYANGAGTRPNRALAMRLACEIAGAPAELQGRLDHLERLEHQRDGRGAFDLCDDITSGFMMGHCAAHAQRLTQVKRGHRWKALLAGWAPAARDAFARLRAAADTFFRASLEGEIDLSGTARAMLQIEEEERLEDDFLGFVEQLEAGTAPVATRGDYRAADKALNAAYGLVTRADAEFGTVTVADIKKTERAWIRYRDQWVRFARTRYPAATPDTIKTWLTRQRTKQLTGEGNER